MPTADRRPPAPRVPTSSLPERPSTPPAQARVATARAQAPTARAHRWPSARLLTAVAVAAVLGLLAGCGGDAWARPRVGPTASGTLAPGFMPSTGTPSPEATVTPEPGSWSAIAPVAGYRVVLLTSGSDAPTTALVDAVTRWARATDVDLRLVRASDADHLVDAIVEAMDLHPDLIVSAGDDLVDPLAIVTASHLDQQFLVVGAELAEPTINVTAADWTGAAYRGEGLGTPSAYDPTSFTADRCDRAVRVGVAAVLAGRTGLVFWVD